MNAVGLGMDELRQGLDIRGQELGELPVGQDLLRQRMQRSELLQDLSARGHAGLRLSDRAGRRLLVELKLIEQNLPKLDGRVRVELPSRRLVDPLKTDFQLGLQRLAQIGHQVEVEQDARLLHVRQDGNQEDLQIVED